MGSDVVYDSITTGARCQGWPISTPNKNIDNVNRLPISTQRFLRGGGVQKMPEWPDPEVPTRLSLSTAPRLQYNHVLRITHRSPRVSRTELSLREVSCRLHESLPALFSTLEIIPRMDQGKRDIPGTNCRHAARPRTEAWLNTAASNWAADDLI